MNAKKALSIESHDGAVARERKDGKMRLHCLAKAKQPNFPVFSIHCFLAKVVWP